MLPLCSRMTTLFKFLLSQGKGVKMFKKVVEPIFLAAGCHLTVVRKFFPYPFRWIDLIPILLETERHGHAFDYVKTLSLEYDAIVTVSGDGLIHEVLNGLAQHENPMKALDISLAPIPAGSGNGLALNLIGIEVCARRPLPFINLMSASSMGLTRLVLPSTWSRVRIPTLFLCARTSRLLAGRPMKTDLFSITQGGKRSLSFMSQSLGLMADLDLDTEHLRWIGDTRFIYGMLRGSTSLVRFSMACISMPLPRSHHFQSMSHPTFNEGGRVGQRRHGKGFPRQKAGIPRV